MVTSNPKQGAWQVLQSPFIPNFDKEPNWVTCKRCGYQWDYRGVGLHTMCRRCQLSTPVLPDPFVEYRNGNRIYREIMCKHCKFINKYSGKAKDYDIRCLKCRRRALVDEKKGITVTCAHCQTRWEYKGKKREGYIHCPTCESSFIIGQPVRKGRYVECMNCHHTWFHKGNPERLTCHKCNKRIMFRDAKQGGRKKTTSLKILKALLELGHGTMRQIAYKACVSEGSVNSCWRSTLSTNNLVKATKVYNDDPEFGKGKGHGTRFVYDYIITEAGQKYLKTHANGEERSGVERTGYSS